MRMRARLERWRCAAGLAWLSLLTPACGGAPISSLRFHNRPPITAVDDEQPIAMPAERDQGERAWQVDALLHLPLDHALSVPGPQHAQDVSSIDEVPSSSWFEPRISVRALTPVELACGPRGCEHAASLASGAFKAFKVKSAGTAPGLLVEDAAGARYLLKIDPGAAEAETAAEVVVQRLMWAAGYHVPNNEVVYLTREQLSSADDNKVKSADIDRVFDRAAKDDRGRARVLLSELLAGKPVGGFPMMGLRGDDPNDRIPHEHRRSLRGLELIFAWLGQTDVKEANTLDMWVETDEGKQQGKQLGVVRHHQLDFGKSLGVWGLSGRERDAFAPHFDYADATSSLFTFGLERWPWEGLKGPPLRGIGRFEAERFDPARYSPTNPYAPILNTDRYWAAKIIARFSTQHLAAAIDAGRYSDPAARKYLLTTLQARQRKAVSYGFSEVSTLDDFEVQIAAGERFALCARDLAVVTGLVPAGYAQYWVRVYDWEGESLQQAGVHAASGDGRICVHELAAGAEHDGYTMVAYETRPPRGTATHIVAHLARDPVSHRMRLIGLERR
jgi:hypothetical protein